MKVKYFKRNPSNDYENDEFERKTELVAVPKKRSVNWNQQKQKHRHSNTNTYKKNS